MTVISKSDFSKFAEKYPENVFLLRSTQGVLTLLSELELTEENDTLRVNQTAFELNWRNCSSALKEIEDCRNRYSGGISCEDNLASKSIDSFMTSSGNYIKYISADDSELEPIARSFPSDLIYLFIRPAA